MNEPIALIFDDQYKLVKGFSEFFIKLLDSSDGIFNVALSGGSTPKIWFDYIAKNYKDSIDWERVHFYWGDERCVPPEDQESNYGMTKKHLLDFIPIPEENVHRIKGELVPQKAVEQYITELSENIAEDKIPIFELVILGLGDDGHTASIFPHQIDLWDSEESCVVATHPISGQHRVSISGQVINHAKAVAFLVTGEGKKERVHEIIQEDPRSAYYPASLVSPKDGTLHWFLDRPAATYISDDI